MRTLLTLIFGILLSFQALAQSATLKGSVADSENGMPLIGATVVLVGTYKGGSVDIDGNFVIKDIKPGDYTVKISFLGYAEKVYTGIVLEAGKTRNLKVRMSPRSSTLSEVEIVGDKSLVNLEEASSEVKIGSDQIKEMAVRDVKDIVNMQAGVTQTPDGINIRGGRNYETQYIVDGISAQDPLAGTGFGVNVSSSSIDNLNLITGGAGAEYGGGAGGVISTRIKEGGKKFEIGGSWQRDNLGWGVNEGASWNTDIVDINMGGSVPFTKKKLRFFLSGNAFLSDDYYRIQADQLHSSYLEENDSLWAPRQNNKWTTTAKLTYEFKPGTKLTLTNQHSLAINQNSRSLQIVGFDAIVQPGLQYQFAQIPDNANTYTHSSDLMALNFNHYINDHWNLSLSAGRLFINLREDANGRPFRTETVDQIFDPRSIVTDPVTFITDNTGYNYTLPPSGFINNGGIASSWHDHYVEEYTGKVKVLYYPKNKVHKFSMGWEHKELEYQWADVSSPWVGAPIQVNDSVSTPSVSIGTSSEIWNVRPTNGGIFVQDELRYKGINATLGLRYNYWAYGKKTDAAIDDPNAPINETFREEYTERTTALGGKRYAARLLPKLNVSFPVSENNVLYFNYGHSMQMPHPRFLYAGLDPEFLDQSYLSTVGNPNLKPEATVSYEIGYKTQITKDLGVTIAAYNNDKYDYIVSRTQYLEDQTGQLVPKRIYINQDYARIIGVELGVQQRIGKYMRVFFNGSFQSATGKSNSARESALQIQTQGFVDNTKEQPLAWDRPWDLKSGIILRTDTSIKLGRVSLKNFRVFASVNYKSGFRYTPHEYIETNVWDRPIYRPILEKPNSEVAKGWFWTDIKITRDFFLKDKKKGVSLSVQIKNVFNNQNAYIVNPVTGDGYREGDDVPESWRDVRFDDPLNYGIPPDNPARWRPPRHVLFGLSFRF